MITGLGETMRTILFATAVAVFFCSAIAAELQESGELLPYSDWQKMATAGGSGDYYVLVSAEWCQPCTRLKDRLRGVKYGGYKFGIVDVDRSPAMKEKLMKDFGFRTIPALIKYRKADGQWQKPELWDGVDLDKFLGIEVNNESSGVEARIRSSVAFAGLLGALHLWLVSRGQGNSGLGAVGAN